MWREECWIIDREGEREKKCVYIKNSRKSLHLQGASIDRFAVNCLQFLLLNALDVVVVIFFFLSLNCVPFFSLS
jgi:hypothetical protein